MHEIHHDVLELLWTYSRDLRSDALRIRSQAHTVQLESGAVRRRIMLRRETRGSGTSDAQALATSSVISPT